MLRLYLYVYNHISCDYIQAQYMTETAYILYNHNDVFYRWSVSMTVQTGTDCLSVQSQIRQQEEVEKKAEVAMEMSDLVVYCQPRSKEKDRFGKHMQTHILSSCDHKQRGRATKARRDELYHNFTVKTYSNASSLYS